MNLIFRKPIVLILGLFLSVGIVITSCSDDDDNPTPVDFTALEDAIDDATERLAATEEGINDGQFSAAARTALQTAITSAQEVVDDETSTQTDVANAVVALTQAVETYNAAEIAPVAVEALVAHWSFDEGTGTVAGDNSENGFDGTLKTGHIDWGGGFPAWSEDRHGDDGKALHFDEGANIEIPYSTALNPSQMSIALWVNADEINENNRFLGLHSWVGYKFQLQSTNRPFFTVHNDEDGYYDRDAEVELPINEWHHIAVTFGGGNTIFYIDGVAVKTWDNTPGEAMSIADDPYNLVIGQDFPTDMYSEGDGTGFDDPNSPNYRIIPLAWGGYFRGLLDEVRIYNTVLTASQIETVYNREKPE
ncbi:MAG TPA: LamG-like jellyroll fold domain-containing protein [Chryseosolibacter sp.]|nr:LamG-like jellyroll fold domain-containing protein [Chryseosolibacter sp.]